MNLFPLVSIVIPVYNGANYLDEAIESAIAQTYKNIEIIVVNDGSNDNGATENIAISYGDKIRYFSKPNGGVSSALNLAISQMKGEYFSWLSHDDLYYKEKVARGIEALNKLGVGKFITYSNFVMFEDNSEGHVIQLQFANPKNLYFSTPSPEHFRYWITINNKLQGCTLLIPKLAFIECGTFNEQLLTTQDYDLWFRMAKKYKFIHIPDTLVKFRIHPAQTGQTSDIRLTECNTLLINFIKDLTTEEILEATGYNLVKSYKLITKSMQKRQFKEAAHFAEQLAYKAAKQQRRIIFNKFRDKIIWLFSPKLLVKEKTQTTTILSTDLKEKFTEIYDKNLFLGELSKSGEGSNLIQTTIIREEIPKLLKKYDIKIFLDAPCGDWYWMKEVDLGVEKYIGVDIVEDIISNNNKKFGSDKNLFECLNIATDLLPKSDLIFCRDCLVHLSFQDAMNVITNFKRSGAKYLLTTTFTDRTENHDLIKEDVGTFWDPRNLQIYPFNFVSPLELINEGCTEAAGVCKDKSLGLWRLHDLIPILK